MVGKLKGYYPDKKTLKDIAQPFLDIPYKDKPFTGEPTKS